MTYLAVLTTVSLCVTWTGMWDADCLTLLGIATDGITTLLRVTIQ